MIDPYRITDFGRDDAALEEFFLFAAAVAGKKATMIAQKIDEFVGGCGHPGTPFERLRAMAAEGSLGANMRRVRLGKYALLERCYREALDRGIDLRRAGPAELEAIHGVAAKTARFFILHSRPGVRIAVIDTHMLKHLRALGHDAPKGVPNGRRYAALEEIVLAEAERAGMSPADYDLMIWARYASGAAREKRPGKAKVRAPGNRAGSGRRRRTRLPAPA